MRRNDKKTSSQIAQALGASRAVPLQGVPAGGPLDLLQLRADAARRLRSSGGRPTDPHWDVHRLIPFSDGYWRQLEELAGRLSADGKKVSAGQLAAMLIESALDSLGSPDYSPLGSSPDPREHSSTE